MQQGSIFPRMYTRREAQEGAALSLTFSRAVSAAEGLCLACTDNPPITAAAERSCGAEGQPTSVCDCDSLFAIAAAKISRRDGEQWWKVFGDKPKMKTKEGEKKTEKKKKQQVQFVKKSGFYGATLGISWKRSRVGFPGFPTEKKPLHSQSSVAQSDEGAALQLVGTTGNRKCSTNKKARRYVLQQIKFKILTVGGAKISTRLWFKPALFKRPWVPWRKTQCQPPRRFPPRLHQKQRDQKAGDEAPQRGVWDDTD